MRVIARFFTCGLLTVIGICAFSHPGLAESRVALVIGNAAYKSVPALLNPTNDANDVAAALRRDGFETILATNLDKDRMDEATIRFAKAARNADVAMFYYSGHAMQFAGVNYLAPIDAKLTDEADLRRMVRLDEIVADLQQAKNLRILVMDSCRNNPLADELKRSIGTTRALNLQRGLAKIDTPQGMIVAYSTQAGTEADDGSGRNSPYTSAFLRNIEAKEEIGTIFRRISSDVYETTNHKQLPELSLSLIGEFYLRGKIDINVTTGPSPSVPDPAQRDFEATERVDTVPAWDAFLAQHPSGLYAALAQERRARAAAKTAMLPNGPAPAPPARQEAVIADGSAATDDLLFWKFVEAHRSRRTVEAYLQKFPSGFFAEVARSRLQNMQSQTASAGGSLPGVERLLQPEIRIANRPVVVLEDANPLGNEVGDLQKGAQVVVQGSLTGSDMVALQSPYIGYAPARAFSLPDDGDQHGAELRSAQRKLMASISAFDDDAVRLQAPVWGAIAVDKAATFYGVTVKPDKDTASRMVMDDCQKASKAGNCQLVRLLFRTCFALSRKSSDNSKWVWVIRDTPELAKADAQAACAKNQGTCRQDWLVCGDNRR